MKFGWASISMVLAFITSMFVELSPAATKHGDIAIVSYSMLQHPIVNFLSVKYGGFHLKWGYPQFSSIF